jgi:hypothetical protein
VTIERTFYCDAPECSGYAKTTTPRAPYGMLTVSGSHMGVHHFCSWDCVLKYAAAREPVETVPFHDSDAP